MCPLPVCRWIGLASRCEVSVVIVSLSGRDDVFRACESALAQSFEEKEILVFLDHNDDRRANIIRQQCPAVRIFLVDPVCSYIVYRNAGFQEARGEFVVWIDDDAYFSGRHTLRNLVGLFSKDPATAAIAVRFVEPHLGRTRGHVRKALGTGTQVRDFVGCSVAFRKDVVARLGGLRELYYAYGEERDLALRILQSGFSVRYLATEPIVHLPSPQRNKSIQDSYPVRNTILFNFLNVPFPDVIPRMLSDSIKLFAYKVTWRNALVRLRYMRSGFEEGIRSWNLREPVGRAMYRAWRSLPRPGVELVTDDNIPAPVAAERPDDIRRVSAI